jgi:hypothetical protein
MRSCRAFSSAGRSNRPVGTGFCPSADFRDAILPVPLAIFLDGIFDFDLGNVLEGISSWWLGTSLMGFLPYLVPKIVFRGQSGGSTESVNISCWTWRGSVIEWQAARLIDCSRTRSGNHRSVADLVCLSRLPTGPMSIRSHDPSWLCK